MIMKVAAWVNSSTSVAVVIPVYDDGLRGDFRSLVGQPFAAAQTFAPPFVRCGLGSTQTSAAFPPPTMSAAYDPL